MAEDKVIEGQFCGGSETVEEAICAMLLPFAEPTANLSEGPQATSGPGAARSMAGERERLNIRDAAQALVDQMQKVSDDPRYQAVWQIHQLHNGPYTGPKYETEWNMLVAALVASPVVAGERQLTSYHIAKVCEELKIHPFYCNENGEFTNYSVHDYREVAKALNKLLAANRLSQGQADARPTGEGQK